MAPPKVYNILLCVRFGQIRKLHGIKYRLPVPWYPSKIHRQGLNKAEGARYSYLRSGRHQALHTKQKQYSTVEPPVVSRKRQRPVVN